MPEIIQHQEGEINKELKIKSYFGIIIAILIGCSLIGFSIILGAYYLANKAYNTSRIVASLNQSAKVPAEEDLNKTYDLKIPEGTPFLGNSDAKVTVVEFGDFQCPYCKDFFDTVLPQLKEQYISRGVVKFYFQDFAFLGPESQRAAEAARCAQDQNKFWDYYDVLYQNQKSENGGGFSDTNLKKFAVNLKLDPNSFNKCLDSGAKKSEVEQETAGAEQNLNVNSTPTLFINGKKSEGVMPFSLYEQLIKSALNNK